MSLFCILPPDLKWKSGAPSLAQGQYDNGLEWFHRPLPREEEVVEVGDC